MDNKILQSEMSLSLSRFLFWTFRAVNLTRSVSRRCSSMEVAKSTGRNTSPLSTVTVVRGNCFLSDSPAFSIRFVQRRGRDRERERERKFKKKGSTTHSRATYVRVIPKFSIVNEGISRSHVYDIRIRFPLGPEL